MVLTLFHGQKDVQHGFSLSDKHLVENMQEPSLIAQCLIKDHMLFNGYQSHNVPITGELMNSIKSSSSLYMTASKEKRDETGKAERNEKVN